jgi:hypothetical protein
LVSGIHYQKFLLKKEEKNKFNIRKKNFLKIYQKLDIIKKPNKIKKR